MQEEDSDAPNPPKKSGKRRSSKGKNKVVGFSQWFFSLVYHLGQISSRPLGPQNLAEEGEYLREIQVGEMIIILARYLPWNYLYERGWVRLPTTYVFLIGHVENQWSFCWLGGVKVVQGDRSDGRILQTETRGGKLAGVKFSRKRTKMHPPGCS